MMGRIEVAPDHQLLLALVRDPGRLVSLSPTELSRALDAASHARLLGWLLSRLEESQRDASDPDWLRDRVVDARAMVAEYDRSLRWEIDRLARAFSDLDAPWVLLKGAAYLAANLAPGRGRRVADVDVMVPENRLEDAERALRAHGWDFGELDAYDERYYREWMHELPPMVHQERGSIVDLHHAILPRTSRLKPSSARLFAQAVPVQGGGRVLSPAHMVLHAAAHLFHDGEIAGAIRDLVDLDGLLRRFSQDQGFWNDLTREAGILDLRRPAWYSLRYSGAFVLTPFPSDVWAKVEKWRPNPVTQSLMDGCVEQAISGHVSRGSSAAAWTLYVRSHWLRMPASLLIRHLTHQASRR